ncbi:hypothetical protein ACEUZ9_004673 [Paracoccus litorisediminis]|uniref:hypothetical protein n=1 Tax=Paracoccus litorisediminis TaxID=2006130 RepID=UPI003731EA6F
MSAQAQDPHNMLAEHKWVRIMTDFCADGVWDKDGAAAHPDDLPVSEELRQRILDWQAIFDNRRHDDPIPDYENFLAEGLAIAQAVKDSLPDWTVVYFDMGKLDLADPEQSRTAFEYEI